MKLNQYPLATVDNFFLNIDNLFAINNPSVNKFSKGGSLCIQLEATQA